MTSNRTPPEATRRHIRNHTALHSSPIPANVKIPPNNPIHDLKAVPLPDPLKNEKRGRTTMYADLYRFTANRHTDVERKTPQHDIYGTPRMA